jgi:hypothetical protein
MADCVNCKCADIVVGKTACKSLKAQNDDVIKQHALVLRDTQLCDIVDQTAKFAYSQWCFNKNMSNQLCWIAENMGGGNNSALEAENAKLKATLQKIIDNLQASGAWQGGLDGDFVPNRNIATGNINLFGGATDGSSFIRTNNGSTENDLAGGIG